MDSRESDLKLGEELRSLPNGTQWFVLGRCYCFYLDHPFLKNSRRDWDRNLFHIHHEHAFHIRFHSIIDNGYEVFVFDF